MGRGVYGKVKLAINQDTNQLVAIKIVSKKSKRKLGQKMGLVDPQQDKIRKEIAILKKCDHLNIVRLFEVIDNPASEKIYLGNLGFIIVLLMNNLFFMYFLSSWFPTSLVNMQ